MKWVEPYLRIPFVEKGRSREGADCYGLVRLVYQERLGIELPSYVENYATTQDQAEIRQLLAGEVGSRWREIRLTDARPYDGLIFRIAGQPTHFGLVVEPPWFLHTIKRTGAATGKAWLERWDALLWNKRLLAAVRWQSGT